MFVIHDTGNFGEVFARGADGGDMYLFCKPGVRYIGPDEVFGFMRGFAPQMICRPDFDLVVIDPEIHGLVCPALENYAVDAGKPQLGRKISAGV